MKKNFLKAFTLAAAMLMGGSARVAGLTLSDLKLVDGFYEIGSLEEFKAFIDAVGEGQVKINGRLTADLDNFTEDYMVPTYEGHFDGQYHTITVNIKAADEQGTAIFKFVQNGALIENMGAKGTIVASNKAVASFVGEMRESTLRNCWSTVDVVTTVVGDATGGGMIGRMKTTSTIENCIFAGTLKGEQAFKSGGLVGYLSQGGNAFTNCVVMGEYALVDNDNNTFARKPNNAIYTNCYYLNTSRFADVSDKCIEITAEQVSSGELCFMLNGDQTAIAFYQSLGEDKFPVPNPSSARVYSTADVSCSGSPIGTATYTNDASKAGKVQDHDFQHGFCANCNVLQPGYLTAGEDGWYDIADEYALAWFAVSLNGGVTPADAKARLTADIDLSAYTTSDYMIGAGRAFKGTFDGQQHEVNINFTDDQNYAALFREIDAATIKNLTVTGTVNTSLQFAGGVVGHTANNPSTLEQVASFVTINTTRSGDGTHGGIIGLPDVNATLTNVLFGGAIKGTSTNACGGMVGWANGKISFTNCLMIGELACNLDACATFSRNPGNATYTNCYFGLKAPSLQDNGKGTKLTDEEIASGKAAFLLNGKQFANPVWYQTVGDDTYPTINGTHGVVYEVNGEYGCVIDSDVTELCSLLGSMGSAYVAEMTAQKTLKEAYVQQCEAASKLTTLAEIGAAYNELMKAKATLDASAAAYASYINKVNETSAYLEAHPELKGEICEKLQDYLQGNDAPDAENPYGAALYIIDNELLTVDELKSEEARIDTWLTRVVASNAEAGSEVTTLLTNPDFSSNYSGWSGKGGSTPSKAGLMPVAFCYNSTMNRYQTLEGVKNGVYEVVMNGSFFTNRSADNALNTNYAATLYAGSNEVPVMAVSEDALLTTQAKDGENCWIATPNTLPYDFVMTFSWDGDEYYIPSHETGAGYAFNGGRYVNRILVNVTDGKLTLGIRVDGNGVSGNLTSFANTHLYYLGEISEAGEGIARVLEGQVARANTILEKYEVVTDTHYALAPNFSETIKTNLKNLVAQAAEATDNAARYALIEKFSQAFTEVFEGKKAYREMYDLTSKLDAQSYYLSDEGLAAYQAEVKTIEDAYEYGTFTTEEALAAAQQLNDHYGYLIPEKKNGYYQLGSVAHWVYFTKMVNGGETTAKAQLTADIDMSDMDMTPLSTFSGELDGQGHKLTIYMKATGGDGYAPIRESRGITVRNLYIAGTVEGGGERKITSLIGNNKEKPLVLERVYSTVTLKSTYSGDSSISGFCADNRDVDGTSIIRDCAFAGAMLCPNAANTGGLIGWNKSPLEVENSMVAIIYEAQITNSSTLIRQSSSELTKFTNSYYLVPTATLQGTALTEEQYKSGEATYLLNAGRAETVWFQTLGEDALPVLSSTSKVVYKLDDGTYSNEVAAPKADLLDVVFNEDGTATDVSPMQNTVELCGTTSSTYFSTTYNRYAARFANPWGSTCTGWYKVDYENNDAIRNALADGHTLEMLVMGDYEGTIQNVEAKPFSAMQGGGTGFLICKTNSSGRQNEFTFLPNVTENGNSTWRWTNSGVVPAAKTYYHVIGVWNKEQSKAYIYVNGELKNTIDAPGEFRFAQSGCNWFCIGGDADPNGGGQGWTGDVVIARAYDKAISQAEAVALWNKLSSETGVAAVREGATGRDAIYDLFGRRVEKATKGLYIIDGKKVIVK